MSQSNKLSTEYVNPEHFMERIYTGHNVYTYIQSQFGEVCLTVMLPKRQQLAFDNFEYWNYLRTFATLM